MLPSLLLEYSGAAASISET